MQWAHPTLDAVSITEPSALHIVICLLAFVGLSLDLFSVEQFSDLPPHI